ncbi:arginase [Colletotrichum phormii]|uniref:Arginase n=1 Tax=Colletotrichum phormii TaxID=359342 RepID=A0AAI9ZPK0_9PEZI|nr:arginase [Colletotrichum phormii]KAK1635743.1 arginase [Colletotrichum phormii]
MSTGLCTIIVSPYHVGTGPNRILSHNLADKLKSLTPIRFINIGPVDDFEGEIGRTFELLRRTSTAVSQAVAANSFPLVLSGNCYASTAVAAGLNATVPDLNVQWIDAHDDLDTPSTNENGYLDAMALSMAAGMSWHKLMGSVPGHKSLSLERVAYCGLRDVSELQRKTVTEAGVDVIWGDAERKVDFAKELGVLLDRRRFDRTHVHLDLDVLDESLGRVNEFPSPGGLDGEDLMGCLETIPSKTRPTSLFVCSFNAELEGGDTVARLAVKGIVRFVEGLFRLMF